MQGLISLVKRISATVTFFRDLIELIKVVLIGAVLWHLVSLGNGVSSKLETLGSNLSPAAVTENAVQKIEANRDILRKIIRDKLDG